MITSRTVEKIMDATRIEDVVREFVQLKTRGVNLLGLCPFHPEKTPSFTVSPSKNLFKCFGCGKGGDAIAFLKEHEGFTYPEALRWLAARYHIEVEELEDKRAEDPEEQLKDQLYVVNQYARDYYVQQMWDTDEGKSIGLSYFKGRGFREAILRRFELGYAPPGGQSFALHAVQQGFKPDTLQKAGLVTQRNRDFFRDRVMFTIHSLSGKPVAFAGRVMGQSQGPKYINSPETAVYHKSNSLFGLYFARPSIIKQDECYLVEGYTDVLALAQEGFENVVASSGTSLTPEQIRLIKRFTQNLTILYDGDLAGLKAAMRGLDLVLEQDMNVRIVMLPEGEDPDSFLFKSGYEAFAAYLEREKKDFILFKAQMLGAGNTMDPVGRTALIRDLVHSLARIVDPIKRSSYTKSCAERLHVDEALLIREVNKELTARLQKDRHQGASPLPSTSDPEETSIPAASPLETTGHQGFAQEQDLIRILVLFSDKEIQVEDRRLTIASYFFEELDDEVLEEVDHAESRHFLLWAKSSWSRGQALSPGYFLQQEDPLVRQLALRFHTEEDSYSANWERRWQIVLHNQPVPDQNYIRDAIQALFRFKLKYLNHLCQINATRIREAFDQGDDEQLAHHLRFQEVLQQMRNTLASGQLNTTIIR